MPLEDRRKSEGGRAGWRELPPKPEPLIDSERDDTKHQVRHDFGGAAKIDESPSELVLQTAVELFDDGAFFEALLLCFTEGVLPRRAGVGGVRLNERFVAEFLTLRANELGVVSGVHVCKSKLHPAGRKPSPRTSSGHGRHSCA